MLDTDEFERWWSMARDAREAARIQAAHDSRRRVCSLARQSGQLAAKALLHGMGAGAWGHDPVRLGRPERRAAGRCAADGRMSSQPQHERT